jgi:hypothetical protein
MEIATHIRKFWEPRMRHELLARVRWGDTTLHPLLVAAAGDLVDGAAAAGLAAISTATATTAFASGRPATATATATDPSRAPRRLFGPLMPAGEHLHLPADFSYQIIAEAGVTELLDPSGTVIGTSPTTPDGLGVFRAGNRLRLVLNHELRGGEPLSVPHSKGTVYDPGVLGGGCTVLEVTSDGRRLSQWVGLSARCGTVPAASRPGEPGSPARRARTAPAPWAMTGSPTRRTTVSFSRLRRPNLGPWLRGRSGLLAGPPSRPPW